MAFTMSEAEDDDGDGGHGLISCDPPSFPVIFFITLPFKQSLATQKQQETQSLIAGHKEGNYWSSNWNYKTLIKMSQ